MNILKNNCQQFEDFQKRKMNIDEQMVPCNEFHVKETIIKG